ncbi:hypothetical protein BDN71DRAFT_1404986, partial [Pleurotus eryngii]
MVRDVAKIASELPTEEAHLPLHGSSRELPVVAGALDLDTVWPNSSPIALRGTPGLQLDWSPSGLADAFGDDACILEDCEVPGQRMKTTIRSFFEGLVTLNSGDETSGSILKLKDYPPDMTFKEKSPNLARDFQIALPGPLYTSDEGPLNLANFFPTNYLYKPDLGPKMYAAMASRQDDIHHGSTRLHMDMADAVNIMASNGRALWHIFASEDSQQLRKFMTHRFKGLGHDPIHAQQVYLTPCDLDALKAETGVVPFTFEQLQGDVVFIPTGCAHQVSNITACIKIAVDFVSPQNLARCSCVAQELRASQAASECLEFTNLLIHAWM